MPEDQLSLPLLGARRQRDVWLLMSHHLNKGVCDLLGYYSGHEWLLSSAPSPSPYKYTSSLSTEAKNWCENAVASLAKSAWLAQQPRNLPHTTFVHE